MKALLFPLFGGLVLMGSAHVGANEVSNLSFTLNPMKALQTITATSNDLLDKTLATSIEGTRLDSVNVTPAVIDTLFNFKRLPRRFVDGAMCVTPSPINDANIDIHRTLFVHDAATLGSADFSLRRTLQKISNDVSSSVPGTSPESVFQQLWDTQNDTINAETTGTPHCDDNTGLINGFPSNKCPRAEGKEASGSLTDIADRIDNDYQPLALINRIDLADKNWKNCGEHRIIYGRQDGIEKNLIIFEAVLPNPKPGCRSGCRDVVEFWMDLSNDNNPNSRAVKLADFYYNGLSGFSEVVHTNHYASGVKAQYGNSNSGQIRTNQFLASSPGAFPDAWTLKEFRTFLSCVTGSCDFNIMPTSVKNNPYGQLWKRDIANGVPPSLPSANPYAIGIPNIAALAGNFQSDVIAQVTPARLANPDINGFSYAVDSNKNGAESQSLSPTFDHYRNQATSSVDGGFISALNAAGLPFGLTANHLINRATTLSCAGCHQPGSFGLNTPNALGAGLQWPNSLGFVHVQTSTGSLLGEPEFNPANFSGNSNGFVLSQALLDVFLPHREDLFVNLANTKVCNCAPAPSLFEPLPPLRRAELLEALKKIEIAPQPPIIDPAPLRLSPSFISKPPLSISAQVFPSLTFKQASTDLDLSAIRLAEKEQITLLQKEGIVIRDNTADQKAIVVNLTGSQLNDLALKETTPEALKREAFEVLNQREEPRETITGSFRTH